MTPCACGNASRVLKADLIWALKSPGFDDRVVKQLESLFLTEAIEKAKGRISTAHRYADRLLAAADAHEGQYVPVLEKRFAEMKREIVSNLKSQKRPYERFHVKISASDALFNRKKWTVILGEDNKKQVWGAYRDAGNIANDAWGLGTTFDMNMDATKKWISANARKVSESVTQTISDEIKFQLEEAIGAGESIDDIIDRIMPYLEGDDAESKAESIARTEVLKASNRGAKESFKRSGVVSAMEWLATEDEVTCEECMEMNGKVVGLDENFFDEGDEYEFDSGVSMTFDYEDVETPPLHTRCRCTIIPVLKDQEEVAALARWLMKRYGLFLVNGNKKPESGEEE